MDAIVIATALSFVTAARTFGRPRHLRRPTAQHALDSRADTVSIIVPARNEAASIGTLLASIAALPPDSAARIAEVIVVNDSSTDGTTEIATAAGAHVVDAGPLPDGWCGKNWACHRGAASATGDQLLFLDADTALGSGALAGLDAALQRHGGLISVQPFHRATRAYEDLSCIFNAVSVMGSGAFVIGPAAPVRVAFGPCLLTARRDYDRVGGHAAVRDEIVEDIALARRYRDAGLLVTCRLGRGDLHFRMYPDGIRSLTEGWTKNIALGTGMTPAAAVVPAVVWVMTLVAVTTGIATGIGTWLFDGGSRPLVAAFCWLAVTCQIGAILCHLGSFRRVTMVLWVVPLAFFLFIFARSTFAVARRRPMTWRGRSVPSRPGRPSRIG